MLRWGDFSIDTDAKVGATLINHKTKQSVYFQPGDDAGQFFDDLENLEIAFSEESYETLLAILWEQYQPQSERILNDDPTNLPDRS